MLDTVQEAARRMMQRVSRADRRKVDEYFTSVREAELQLAKSEQWQHKPKPKVGAGPPQQIRDRTRIIQKSKQIYDIMFLALQTDSTRLMTYSVGGSSYVPAIPGVSMNYHDLSHHGQDPEKLKQLAIVESEQVTLFGEFLHRLKQTPEGDSTLLNRTMLLFGSHMHSGNHDNRNLAHHSGRRWLPSRTASGIRSGQQSSAGESLRDDAAATWPGSRQLRLRHGNTAGTRTRLDLKATCDRCGRVEAIDKRPWFNETEEAFRHGLSHPLFLCRDLPPNSVIREAAPAGHRVASPAGYCSSTVRSKKLERPLSG